MRTVITYGTYDLLHKGHINLLRRAKELGDYLIVGVTSEDFDLSRGKVNVCQTLAERMQAVKATGYADLVIPEEYFGQKIDDIINYGVDIFTVGSDWIGHFDYLEEYCEVVYLDRTQGISSTEIRENEDRLDIGVVGSTQDLAKFISEARYVSGVRITGCYSDEPYMYDTEGLERFKEYGELLAHVDAVYVACAPEARYRFSKEALVAGRHVLCKSPVALSLKDASDLFSFAEKRGLIFQEAIKTAHSMAFKRLVLLAKSNQLGTIRSVRATCTSLSGDKGSALLDWGPIALLPVFSLLGSGYVDVRAVELVSDSVDSFAQIDFLYPTAVASIQVGNRVKSEGELVIAGENAYMYVPSPWWKTDYFEIRYEDPDKNRRYFYQLSGEGLRFEVSDFLRMIKGRKRKGVIASGTSLAISSLIEDFSNKKIPVYKIG